MRSELSQADRDGARPLVSVVIPTYNYGAYVVQAIESVLAQDYEPKEIIVADDGSTDSTSKVLGPYVDRVRVLRLTHAGPGAARNAALHNANGEFVAFLDADDLWLAGKLTRQVEAMRQHPEVGLCHSLVEPFDERGRYEPWTPGPDELADGWCAERIFRINSIATSSTMIRRCALPAHGFYEDMPTTQDYALWMEVLFSCHALFIPQILARYRGHPGQISTNKRKRWPIYAGLGRLRLLDTLGLRIDPQTRARLRAWTLEQLEQAAYDRYWRRDYHWASLGFSFLRRYGHSVPLQHRLAAGLRCRLPGYRRPRLDEGNAMGSLIPRA